MSPESDGHQDEPPERRAREWIVEQLDRAGLRSVGPMGEPRIRPWSIVIHVPTDGSAVWFKANRAQTGYEPALANVLARRAPEVVLTPIATDLDRGWSLFPDGGPILRSFPDDDVLRHWERVLPAYSDLQRQLSVRVGELTAAGVPDERPERLPGLFSELLDETDVLFVERPDGLSPAEFSRLRRCGPALAVRCDILATSGIAPTVDHGDLHDGNIFVRDDRYAIFDWGDASIAHPFASLLVTMSALGARYQVASDAPVLQRLRDAYLEPWTDRFSRAELLELTANAVAVAPINRALSWERGLSAVPPDLRGEYREAVPGWLRELIDAPATGQPSP
jgi:Phosphotransferase enzyme family